MTRDLSVTPAYEFWNKQLSYLGDRHPIDVLAETPERIAGLITAYGSQHMNAPRTQGWNGAEILGHLLDIEWTIGYRVRTIHADDRPNLMPMDHDEWVKVQGHAARSAEELLALFRAMRQVTIDFWKRLPAEALQRVGFHTEAELEVSLELYQKIQAGHDLVHLEQLERALKVERA